MTYDRIACIETNIGDAPPTFSHACVKRLLTKLIQDGGLTEVRTLRVLSSCVFYFFVTEETVAFERRGVT